MGSEHFSIPDRFPCNAVYVTKNVVQYIPHMLIIQIANWKLVEHGCMVTEQYMF
jgi:hypothetical protein